MNLKRWLTVILMVGLILAFNPLSGQAGPYHHPHGKAHGWYGKNHHEFDGRHRHSRHFPGGPHHSQSLRRTTVGCLCHTRCSFNRNSLRPTPILPACTPRVLRLIKL